jgi:hypothetical protein
MPHSTPRPSFVDLRAQMADLMEFSSTMEPPTAWRTTRSHRTTSTPNTAMNNLGAWKSYKPSWEQTFKMPSLDSYRFSAPPKETDLTLVVVGIVFVVLGSIIAFVYKIKRSESRRGAMPVTAFTPNVNRQPLTRVTYVPQVVGYVAAATPSAPPGVCTEKFWDPNMDAPCRDSACSICICPVASCATPDIGQGACCGSWFHKDCIAMYFASSETYRCPNCRFDLAENAT